jgi:hypothetical protein
MDGSPQVVRFDATTLWHLDAAEWAPSTASNSVVAVMSAARQLFSQKRKSIGDLAVSQECHEATYAPQQTAALFDHLVGDGKQRWRHHFDEKSR